MGLAALLLLADGRLPTGGHAHSGGLEEAVASGAVGGTEGLKAWLAGRLDTVGQVDAGFAVAAWAERDPLVLSAEYDARTPSPAQRNAARAQGRGLLRAARRCWPHPAVDGLVVLRQDIPWAVVSGVVGRVCGLSSLEVGVAVASSAIAGPAWSATRLMGLDPFEVAAALAALTARVEAVALDAQVWVERCDLNCLPSSSAPWLEIGAEDHSRWEVRLFAS